MSAPESSRALTPILSPALAQHIVLLSAPTQLWSGPDGRVQAETPVGLTHADWRYLSRIAWSFGGQPLDLLSASHESSRATYVWALRTLDDATKDPRLLVTLTREVEAGGLTERVRIENASAVEVALDVALAVRVEIAPLWAVRAGRAGDGASPLTCVVDDDGSLACTTGERSVTLQAEGAAWEVAGAAEKPSSGVGIDAERGAGEDVGAHWKVTLRPGETWAAGWRAAVSDDAAVVVPGDAYLQAPGPSGNLDLDRWALAAYADLRALTLAPRDLPDAPFIAAGAPWYVTLFGRDALWSALLLLPREPALAHGTLRALAHLQADRHDVEANAEPGKILHELRAATHGVPREGLTFPAVYFGSVDSTLLWIRLLEQTWRAGLDDGDVLALLPALRGAVGWLLTSADPDDGGFVTYHDASGHGLANQGWKDSSDAIRFHDGTPAQGPVALCEVQGYAYAAAVGAADMLERWGGAGEGGGEGGGADDVATLRAYAARLQERFREAFWVSVDGRRYPAVALDRDKRAVDSLTSNIGHLLGTGLLSPAEEAEVAALLVAPDMLSGYGLRTLSASSGGYWPLSYHCGSVWAHDTAIAVDGLLRAGFPDEARVLAEQALAQAVATGFRVPELIGGQDAQAFIDPVRYPTSCFPQAWSAAAIGAVGRALGAEAGRVRAGR